jgi:hypothetical protein
VTVQVATKKNLTTDFTDWHGFKNKKLCHRGHREPQRIKEKKVEVGDAGVLM